MEFKTQHDLTIKWKFTRFQLLFYKNNLYNPVFFTVLVLGKLFPDLLKNWYKIVNNLFNFDLTLKVVSVRKELICVEYWPGFQDPRIGRTFFCPGVDVAPSRIQRQQLINHVIINDNSWLITFLFMGTAY